MSATIKIDNFSGLNIRRTTALDLAITAPTNSYQVQNSGNFANGDIIAMGVLGTENCEKITVNSVPDTTHIASSANAAFNHARFDPIVSLFGDKIKVFSAVNVNGSPPADGSFAEISGSPFTIAFDEPASTITDAAGDQNTWYKFTYYNSVSTQQTNMADVPAVRGGGYQQYCSIADIRRVAGYKNNVNITDSMIDLKRRAAQAEINSSLIGRYTVPFAAPINPKIAELTKELAAGFLLLDDFGPFTANTTKDGQARVDEVRAYLLALKNGDKYLTDDAGNDISTSGSSNNISSWPNETTRTLAEFDDNGIPIHGGDTMFNIKHQF